MTTLEDRLKRLRERARESSAPQKATTMASLEKPQRPGRPDTKHAAAAEENDFDEVYALMRETADEIDGQEDAATHADADETGESIGSGTESALDFSLTGHRSGRSSGPNVDLARRDRATLHSIDHETEHLTSSATRALQQLHEDPEYAFAARRCAATEHEHRDHRTTTLEVRERPTLHGAVASDPAHAHQPSWASLEEDLADAMGSASGSGGVADEQPFEAVDRDADFNSVPQSDRGPELTPPAADDSQVSELSARLTRLRREEKAVSLAPAPSGPRTAAEADQGEIDATSLQPNDVTRLFDLPKAPDGELTHPPPSAIPAGDWRDRHGVAGRDLSSFEALVKLNTKRLREPQQQQGPSNARRSLPTVSRDHPPSSSTISNSSGNTYAPGTSEDPDTWCCICNEDAVLACTGCDEDLYCQACWVQGHIEMDTDERAEHRRKLVAKHKGQVLSVQRAALAA